MLRSSLVMCFIVGHHAVSRYTGLKIYKVQLRANWINLIAEKREIEMHIRNDSVKRLHCVPKSSTPNSWIFTDFQQESYNMSHHTFSILPHDLAKVRSSNLWWFPRKTIKNIVSHWQKLKRLLSYDWMHIWSVRILPAQIREDVHATRQNIWSMP